MSMTMTGRIGAAAALMALVLGLASACDGGTSPDDGDGTGPGDASIVATVTAEGTPEPGVTVELFDSAGTTAQETATTDSAGEAPFNMLTAGAYDVEVTVPSGLAPASDDTTRKSVSVAESGTATVDFSLVADTSNVVQVNLTASLTFDPDSVKIAPGTVVRWVNGADIFHTVTPDGHSEWVRQEMSTTGETFEHTFDTAGSFPYFCEPHQGQGMTGIIVVEAP